MPQTDKFDMLKSQEKSTCDKSMIKMTSDNIDKRDFYG